MNLTPQEKQADQAQKELIELLKTKYLLLILTAVWLGFLVYTVVSLWGHPVIIFLFVVFWLFSFGAFFEGADEANMNNVLYCPVKLGPLKSQLIMIKGGICNFFAQLEDNLRLVFFLAVMCVIVYLLVYVL